TRFEHGAPELAALVVEDAKREDLRGEPLAVLCAVVVRDAEKDRETAAGPGHGFIADADGGGTYSLDDGAHALRPRGHSSIQGLSPRTTDSTSLAERCPGANTVMLFSSGIRVTYVTLPNR